MCLLIAAPRAVMDLRKPPPERRRGWPGRFKSTSRNPAASFVICASATSGAPGLDGVLLGKGHACKPEQVEPWVLDLVSPDDVERSRSSSAR